MKDRSGSKSSTLSKDSNLSKRKHNDVRKEKMAENAPLISVKKPQTR